MPSQTTTDRSARRRQRQFDILSRKLLAAYIGRAICCAVSGTMRRLRDQEATVTLVVGLLPTESRDRWLHCGNDALLTAANTFSTYALNFDYEMETILEQINELVEEPNYDRAAEQHQRQRV